MEENKNLNNAYLVIKDLINLKSSFVGDNKELEKKSSLSGDDDKILSQLLMDYNINIHKNFNVNSGFYELRIETASKYLTKEGGQFKTFNEILRELLPLYANSEILDEKEDDPIFTNK